MCSSQICTSSWYQNLDPWINHNFSVNYHKSLVKFVLCYRYNKRFNHFHVRTTHIERYHNLNRKKMFGKLDICKILIPRFLQRSILTLTSMYLILILNLINIQGATSKDLLCWYFTRDNVWCYCHPLESLWYLGQSKSR